jgi:ribosomal protein L15
LEKCFECDDKDGGIEEYHAPKKSPVQSVNVNIRNLRKYFNTGNILSAKLTDSEKTHLLNTIKEELIKALDKLIGDGKIEESRKLEIIEEWEKGAKERAQKEKALTEESIR